MNWYLTKKANAQLGMNLGKWLVLEHNGNRNEIGVKNDIMTFITQNPVGIDTAAARSAALNFFVTQTKQQPQPNLTAILDQWLTMVEGDSLSQSNVDQPLETGVGNETEFTF